MKQRVRLTENDLHRIIAESVKKVLNEYDSLSDWENNSNASPQEIDAARKKHDERNRGNSFHGDKLAYRQHINKHFKDRGESDDNKLDYNKSSMKRLRNGWRF